MKIAMEKYFKKEIKTKILKIRDRKKKKPVRSKSVRIHTKFKVVVEKLQLIEWLSFHGAKSREAESP